MIINDGNYNEVIMKEEKQPFILVFISKTCIHCKTVESFMKKVSPNYENISIYFVQSEESPKLLSLFNISSFPTTHFFKEDKSGIKRIVGATSISDFIDGFELINVKKKKSLIKRILKKD